MDAEDTEMLPPQAGITPSALFPGKGGKRAGQAGEGVSGGGLCGRDCLRLGSSWRGSVQGRSLVTLCQRGARQHFRRNWQWMFEG